MLILRQSLAQLPREKANRIIDIYDAILYSKAWNCLKPDEKIMVLKGFLGISWVKVEYGFSVGGTKCTMNVDSTKSDCFEVVMPRSAVNYLIERKATYPSLCSRLEDAVTGKEDSEVTLAFERF